jgi:hypothetical protein
MPYLIEILLPLFDNDGRPFAGGEFERVKAEMTERFGGATAFTRSPGEGLWKPEHGEKASRDDVVLFEVIADDLDRSFWTEYRRDLEARFRQDAILIRAHAVQTL